MLLPSKYTIPLYNMLQDPNFTLFDFTYNFYNDAAKIIFEQLFIDTYLYNEIGQETVARFKHQLKTKLNYIYPYYKQLYETELATEGISFLLNKDLEETFTRKLLQDNISDTITNTTGTNDSNYKESSLDNGVAAANLQENSLTSVNNSVDNITNESSTQNNSNNNTNEETKLTSKGNIGTTSSAKLLEEWRNSLININALIIEECRELFMEVF